MGKPSQRYEALVPYGIIQRYLPPATLAE